MIPPLNPPMEGEVDNCRRCGSEMRPGIAMGQTATPGVPDFPGDREASTYSVGGPGKLMTCMKCPACGWSVTGGEDGRRP